MTAAGLPLLLGFLAGYVSSVPIGPINLAVLARAVADDKAAAVKALAAEAHKLLDSLGGDKAQFSDRARAGEVPSTKGTLE